MKRWLIIAALLLAGFSVLAPHPAMRARAKISAVAAGSTLGNGLVAHWTMDEASGANRADSVGSITLTNPAGLTIEAITGELNNAAEFDQADGDHLFSAADPAAVDFNGNQDFTVSAVVWINAGTLNQRRTFVAKYESAGQAQWYMQARNSPNDRLLFGVSNNGTAEVEAIANNFGDPGEDTYILVVGWHDAAADTVNIQVNNGTANSVAHTTGIFNSTSIVRVGRLTTAGFLDGRVDDVRVWNRVLTAGERTELFGLYTLP